MIDHARGNPLALREFARVAARRSPPPVADEPLTIPPRVEAAFAAELPGLPPSTRTALLLAAAGGSEVQVLARVLGADAVAADLEPAESTGLVSVTGGRVRFRHPLARSTVYDRATGAERIAAHRDLAQAYPDDAVRRTWHRAAAALDPDESLAGELVAAAATAQARGGYAEASRAMARAAELSPRRSDREARMLESLNLMTGTGHFGQLLMLSERVRADSDDPVVRARAAHQMAYAMAQSTRQVAALAALDSALGELLAADVGGGWAALTTLASLSYQTGRGADRVRTWHARYVREAPATPGPVAELTAAARAWVEVAMSPLSRPAGLVRQVLQAPVLDPVLPPDLVASHEMLTGATAWLLDEPETALRRLGRAAEMMSRGIAAGQLIQTLMALGQVQFDLGDFAAAAHTARSLVDLAEAHNLAYYRLVGRELVARATAVTGDPIAAAAETEAVLRGLGVGECPTLETNVRVTLARAAFAAGNPEASYRHARSLFDRHGEPVHAHVCYRALGDLASAAVQAGAREEVRGIVELARSHLEGTGNVRYTVILQRALGLLAAGEEAEAYFELATTNPDAHRWPFELAQAQLGYGSWLRRRRRTSQARDQLTWAQETFARLGARAWTELAEVELRAAGVAQPSSDATWVQLTAQERQIVRFAAEGLTNREIGRRLFLSPRTVSTHLYHAFPKLGVTSRAQLRDVLDRLAP